MKKEVLFCESDEIRELGGGDEVAEVRKDDRPRASCERVRRGECKRINSLMLNVRELQEPLLYAATLSPMLIERAGPLIYGGKRRCL